MRNNYKNTEVKDMTAGTPWVIILQFSIPLIFGNIFQQIYIFIDTLIVGKVLGINALSAIGVAEWMIFFVFASIQGITQGCSILMSQKFGAGNHKDLRNVLFNSFCLMIVLMILFTVAGQIIVKPMLIMLHTPKDVIDLSIEYLRVLYMGIPIVFLYNFFAAILRAVGNSQIPLRAMIITAVENIVLDLLFVIVFRWGMRGAALATILSMFTAACYCYIKIAGLELLRLKKADKKINDKVVLELLKLIVPLGLQSMITSFGGLVVQSVINSFGVVFIAGYTAANKLYILLESAASSYGHAMHTFIGQNKGMGKSERVKKGLYSGSLIGIITAYMMSAIMILFGKLILTAFIKGDITVTAQAVSNGYQFLIILSIFFPFLYLLYIMRAWVQGMGNTVWPMISSIVQLVMRVMCALVLTGLIGQSAVYIGEVMAWIGADTLLCFVCYRLIVKSA